MSILIKGMSMPTTGLFFVGVDNANGRDKTVITVERMLGNRDVRQIVGSYELVPVPPHGRLIDADALAKMCQEMQRIEWNSKAAPYSWAYAYESFEGDIDNAPTIIPAEEGET